MSLSRRLHQVEARAWGRCVACGRECPCQRPPEPEEESPVVWLKAELDRIDRRLVEGATPEEVRANAEHHEHQAARWRARLAELGPS